MGTRARISGIRSCKDSWVNVFLAPLYPSAPHPRPCILSIQYPPPKFDSVVGTEVYLDLYGIYVRDRLWGRWTCLDEAEFELVYPGVPT